MTLDLTSPVLAAVLARLRVRFGDRVDAWWQALPDRLPELAGRWDLAIGDPVGRGNTSLVLRCRHAGAPAILKLVPDPALAVAEVDALEAWQASGRVPRVHRFDPCVGALVMEAIETPTTLGELPGAASLEEVALLIRDLHRASPATTFEPLPSRVEFMFSRCAARLLSTEGGTDAIPLGVLEASRLLALRLASSPSPSVLLHGDLHPGNLLAGAPGRGLVVIDPRPCTGDASFDAIDFVFWPEGTPDDWSRRRRQLAARLGWDPDRLRDWCRAVAVVFAVGQVAKGASRGAVQPFLDLAPSIA